MIKKQKYAQDLLDEINAMDARIEKIQKKQNQVRLEYLKAVQEGPRYRVLQLEGSFNHLIIVRVNPDGTLDDSACCSGSDTVYGLRDNLMRMLDACDQPILKKGDRVE